MHVNFPLILGLRSTIKSCRSVSQAKAHNGKLIDNLALERLFSIDPLADDIPASNLNGR